MNELQQNRYDTLLRRVGGLIGPGSKAGEILGEVFPMLDVETDKGDLQLLGQTYSCMGGGEQTGAAGEAPRAQLINPANSGMLITITKVQIATLATATIRYGRRDIPISATIATQIFRDFRVPIVNLPVGSIHEVSSVALANATGQFRLLGNTPYDLIDPNAVAILAPGTGFEIGTGTLVATIHYTFWWRERVAERSELNI